ncbi:MAG: tRNA (uridine(34)/cytosine(34)/5-carboxymethylaminomethyluridine(34)-2'-O)-methyltransferase TrmL [Stenotrophobium sp.]
MIHVALYQPEIPPNTGNIIRLCANTGAALHLIRPLGFRMDDRDLKRAGLDYHEYAEVRQHDSLEQLLAALPDFRLLAFSTKGQTRHDRMNYTDRDILLFGPESRGLPAEVLDSLPPAQRLRIPMRSGSRSINLSNAVAVAVYEAWRQADFAQGNPE